MTKRDETVETIRDLRKIIDNLPISQYSLKLMIIICDKYLILDMMANAFAIQQRIDHYTHELSQKNQKS